MLALVCAECTVESTAGVRLARLVTGEDPDEVEGVEIFCPQCAREEFGDA